MLRCSATRAMTRTLHEPWPKPKRPPSARDPPSQSAAPQKTAESISRKPYHLSPLPCQRRRLDPAGGGLRGAPEPRPLGRRRPPLGQGPPRPSRGETTVLNLDGVTGPRRG